MFKYIVISSAVELSGRVCSVLRCVLQQPAVVPSCGGRVYVYLGAVIAAFILLNYDC
jgi:hypothetical protein